MNEFGSGDSEKKINNWTNSTKLAIIPIKIGVASDFNTLVGVRIRNIHTKFATHPCMSIRDSAKKGLNEDRK